MRWLKWLIGWPSASALVGLLGPNPLSVITLWYLLWIRDCQITYWRDVPLQGFLSDQCRQLLRRSSWLFVSSLVPQVDGLCHSFSILYENPGWENVPHHYLKAAWDCSMVLSLLDLCISRSPTGGGGALRTKKDTMCQWRIWLFLLQTTGCTNKNSLMVQPV